jgi:hypothetical protein
MGLVRSLLFGLAVVLFAVLAFVANIGYWAIGSVLDSDRFVATAGRVFDDPAVRATVASRLADKVVVAITRSDGTVPRPVFVAVGLPIGATTAELETALAGQLGDLMTLPDFQGVRDDAIRALHESLLGTIAGTGSLTIAGGALTLDLNQLVTQLDQRLDPNRPGLFGQPVPADLGTVVLFQASWLDTLARVFHQLDTAQWVLPVLAIVAGLLALLFARHRVHALAWLGGALVLVSGLSLVLVTLGAPVAAVAIGSPGDIDSVVAGILRDLGDGLVRQSVILIGIGVVLLLVGLIGDQTRGRGEPRMRFG